MRVFGTEIAGNHMRGGELSQAQRGYCLGALRNGALSSEVARDLSCSQRCIQKIKTQSQSTHTTASRLRSSRPPILSKRDYRRLALIVKRSPKIKVVLLIKEAGFWDKEKAQLTISRTTLRKALEA